MKRVITITMDIDEKTHRCKVSSEVTEDGKLKMLWDVVQGSSTALVLMQEATRLLEDMNSYILKESDKLKRNEALPENNAT